MGLAASQARLLLLTSRKSDLERSGQNMSEKRMQISSEIQKLYQQKQAPQCQSSSSSGGIFKKLVKGIVNIFKGLSSTGSKQAQPIGPNIDDKIKQLEEEDKRLEMKMKSVDLQHNAVQTEVDGVKKVIDKNVETGFKTFGGGQ